MNLVAAVLFGFIQGQVNCIEQGQCIALGIGQIGGYADADRDVIADLGFSVWNVQFVDGGQNGKRK